DLFRWASAGVRSFANNASCAGPDNQGPLAIFSIDAGTTELNRYNNCNNGGDYDDWITHTPTQVQDAFTNNTGSPVMDANSAETRGLDVIGYTRAEQAGPVPEPTSIMLLGSGLALVVGARRRAQRKSE